EGLEALLFHLAKQLVRVSRLLHRANLEINRVRWSGRLGLGRTFRFGWIRRGFEGRRGFLFLHGIKKSQLGLFFLWSRLCIRFYRGGFGCGDTGDFLSLLPSDEHA